MTYDILIKNGRVIDGTGAPAFNADVGIRNGKIAEIGKLAGAARRTIDAKGQVIAPGFIDTHTHFDAQLLWDPLCTWSCYHGITTVLTGNCSLGVAPLREGTVQRVMEFLCYVEAIPMESLMTVKPSWHTFGEYLSALEGRLGMNVAPMVGHTPIRYYVMGEDSQGRDATPQEIELMKGLVRDSMESGALGLSFSRSPGHFDSQGQQIPSATAKEEELFALAGVLAEMGTGILQSSAGKEAQDKNRLLSRLAEKTGRTVIYNQLGQQLRSPDSWKDHIGMIEEAVAQGLRTLPQMSPITMSSDFTMHNCQMFRGVPSWHPVQLLPDDEKLKAYADPAFRKAARRDLIDWPEDVMAKLPLGRNWAETTWVNKAKLEKNKKYEGLSLRELAGATSKDVIDAFLDLVVEEKLDTGIKQGRRGFDPVVMKEILNYRNGLIGLSDAGAHVQYSGGYGYTSILLGNWVRKHGIMPLETAVKKLSFDQAQAIGVYDRGLLRPGMAADIVIFDPDTVRALPPEKVTDLPGGAWRMQELAEGYMCTIVNGEVLIENGRHTGALPGQVMKNSLYRERQEAAAMSKVAAAV